MNYSITDYKQLLLKNKENFTFEINRLIKAFNFKFDRTFVHIYGYTKRRDIYYFFIFEEMSIINAEDEVRISDLYPSDYVFGDCSKCIDYDDIHNKLNDANTEKIAEFNGHVFKLKVQDQSNLDYLTNQLNERKVKKYLVSHRGIITPDEQAKLGKIEIEIPIIQLLISDEFIRTSYFEL